MFIFGPIFLFKRNATPEDEFYLNSIHSFSSSHSISKSNDQIQTNTKKKAKKEPEAVEYTKVGDEGG